MYPFLGYLLINAACVEAQSSVLTSLNSEFTMLLNDEAPAGVAPGYLVRRQNPTYSVGATLRQRRFSRKGSPFSFEYGLGVHRMTTRLELNRLSGERADLSLQRTELSVPLTLFFDGFKDHKGLFRSQSGLFVSARTGLQFRSKELAANVYNTHVLLGARTRGKRVYVQLSFGWPVWTTASRFTGLGRAFSLQEPARRFTFLSLGYTFRR